MPRRIVPGLFRIGRAVHAHLFGPKVEEEVDEELAFHVEMRVREYLARGMTLAEARRAAVRRFGDVDAVKRTCRRLGRQRERKMKWSAWSAELRQDVALALRQIRRSPAAAAVAVLTLAIGVGASTAVFSVVHGVLLSPLPFREPGS